MGNRGRKSTAAFEVVGPVRIEAVPRQAAPHDLSDEEAGVWAAIVNTEAADRFSPSTVPLLAQFCRHVVHARHIASLIALATADPSLAVSAYDRLLKMQERESRAIAALATKMRITQQATTNHRGNKKSSGARKPWEM